MRIQTDLKEPMRIRVRYNGKEVYDQTLQPGPHDINIEHPKTCGKAEAFIVEDDGSEFPMGSTEYGDCECTPPCA
ncbi:MAG: hypothetical protein WCT03_10710 [Candidatus Obscuribacterales bacterium]|jgi:outer membrane usher protein FimD/PapC